MVIRHIVVALVTLIAACTGDPTEEAAHPKATTVPGLETAVATTESVHDLVRAAGVVTPDGLAPEARDARSDLVAAEARLQVATQQVNRLRALAPTQVSPRKDLEAAVAEEAAARAAAQRARQVMDALGGAANVQGDPGTTWIIGRVPQEAAPFVAVGAAAEFTADVAGRPTFPGTVASAASYVDSASRTAPVRIRGTDRDRRLLPGMTGTIAIEVGAAHEAVVVPEAAVVYDDRQPLVFVADDHGGFTATPVAVGVVHAGHIEIRNGLTAGARVATTGAASLLSAQRLGSASVD